MTNSNSNSINNSGLNGPSDGFITSYLFNDEMDWSTYVGGAGNDACYAITIKQFGASFLTGSTEDDGFEKEQMTGGYFQDELENITGGGLHSDAFVIGLNSDYDLVWSSLFGGEAYINGNNGSNVYSNDEGWAVVADNENLFVGGWTLSTSNFPWEVNLNNHAEAYYQFVNNGSTDGFLAQFELTDSPLTIKEVASSENSLFSVYPNPTNGMLNVIAHGMKGIFELSLYDVIGQRVFSKQVRIMDEGQKIKLDLGQFSSGLYMLTCTAENVPVSSIKVIVQ
jgi:hypothetical protein